MILRKNPKASFKLNYNLVLRIGLVLSLGIIISLLLGFPKFESEIKELEQPKWEPDVVEIPQIKHKFEQPPPPSRPSIPIESESEDLSEDITIDETTDITQYEAWEAPPAPPSEEGPRIRFIPYDEAPEPIGGFIAIQRNVIYPEIAREAGIEGTVVIQAFVSEFGKVTECIVLKGVPKTGLDEAAIDAIKKTRFKPAKQRDRNVGVYISIPVIFKLQN